MRHQYSTASEMQCAPAQLDDTLVSAVERALARGVSARRLNIHEAQKHLSAAATGAVAAKHLAPENVTTAGVIGTGRQARLQIEAAHLVRPFARVLVHGRDPEKATACAADLAERLGIEAEVTTSAETLLRRSQLVVTATPEPVLNPRWLHRELHLTVLGAEDGQSALDPFVRLIADRCVRDTRGALGAVITGKAAGRLHQRDITMCDLTGAFEAQAATAAHMSQPAPAQVTKLHG